MGLATKPKINPPIKEFFMSLVLGKFVDDNGFLGYCIACGREVGLLDRNELLYLLKTEQQLFCFDCDGLESDQIPQVLWSNELHYFVKIDGQWFSINWPNVARSGRKRLAYYQAISDDLFERLQKSLFLSSSANLNADDLGLLLEQDGGGQ